MDYAKSIKEMKSVKRCNQCRHLFSTEESFCPNVISTGTKCYSQDFEIGFESSKGTFWSTEEREKALTEFRVRESMDWLRKNAKEAGERNREKREKKNLPMSLVVMCWLQLDLHLWFGFSL
jgi:hypothetical protein